MTKDYENTKRYTILLFEIIIFMFLFPYGYVTYSIQYKEIRNYILLIAMFIAFGVVIYDVLKKPVYIKKSIVYLSIYQLLLIFTALYNKGGIGDGLQRIFVFPALLIFVAINLRRRPKQLILAFTDVMLVQFLLSLFVFNQHFFPQYFAIDNHIAFLGHVQMYSEYGTLGVFVGYLSIRLSHKNKGLFLICLSILNMLYSDTVTSYMSIGVLVFFLLIYKAKCLKDIISKNVYLISCLLLVVNFCLLKISLISNSFTRWLSIVTNSRVSIWADGVNLFEQKKLLGYGIYGAHIKPYWLAWATVISDRQGFSYAHNTVLQLILDGGIVLLIAFLVYVFYVIKEITMIKDENIRYITSIVFIIYLMIGIFESLTEYVYFFVFLVFSSYMYNIFNNKDEVGSSVGDRNENQNIYK